MPLALDLTAGTQVLGYTIVRPLGAGQMGEVYEATAVDGSRVAVKLLRPATSHDLDLQRRFTREAQVCAELRSPHIVPVMAHGLHEGRPFLVMPMLEGRDLDHWLERTGPLAPEVAVAITLQCCEALAVAHARGVVHRDLKPANIFLDGEASDTLSAIVCDFGVAKVLDEDGTLTASGTVLGTPLYMAPEQLIDSKRVDARSDVWALGMTLYHMLAGRPAHEHVSSIAELVLALSQHTVTPLQTLAPWVSPSLARVVHAALLPRDDRYPSALAMKAALEHSGVRPAVLRAEALVGVSAEQRNVVSPVAELPRSHRDVTTPVDEKKVAEASDTPEPVDPLLGKTLGGKYTLQTRLGLGGMGAVYQAIDPSGARTAVKVMHGESGARALEAARRFTREMNAVRAVDSPYVVKPLDFGVDANEKIPFFVMELLSGRDLASLLGSIGSLAPSAAIALFLQACEALRAAHALGIVHRDIKPSNLFLHEPGGDAVVLKVCDFGIAKRVEGDLAEASTELTRSGGLLGSPLYMSPEHAKNAKNVDARSDVWSLGLSLHETLSGLRPWPGCTSIGEVIVAICTQPIASLSSVAPWIDPRLSAVVERALARDASDRWPTIEAFATALRPFALTRSVVRADLKPSEDANRSARAASVAPPGMVTSGSLRGAVAPALDASVVLPLENRGLRKWAAVGSVAVLLGGAAVMTRALSSPPPREAASSASAALPSPVAASATEAPNASAAVSLAAAPSAPAPTEPVPVASAPAVASSVVTAPRPRVRPASSSATPAPAPPGAAPPRHEQGAPASAAPQGSAAPAASTKATPRTDGRASSRKDDQ